MTETTTNKKTRGAAEGITSAEFARELGENPASIYRAIEDGRISRGVVRGAKGWRILDVEAARADYVANTRPKISTRSESEPAPSRSSSDEDDEPSYTRERSKKLRVERQAKELQLAELRGDLVRVSSVSSLVFEVLSTLRSSLLQLPDRISLELADLSEPSAVRTRLREELGEALSAAAEDLARRGLEVTA